MAPSMAPSGPETAFGAGERRQNEETRSTTGVRAGFKSGEGGI